MSGQGSPIGRREMLAAGGGLVASAAVPASHATTVSEVLEPIRTEWVMNLVVTCAAPEPMGTDAASKDGDRTRLWPIVGGRFWGPRLRGIVVPGGADLPVVRPDGVTVVDAQYRLREDDGTSIVIHNVGLKIADDAGQRRYRLIPTFTTVRGRHDWLNQSVFVASLITQDRMPGSMRLAVDGQNDRLIQVHRLS